jgi:hypothetical protein
MEATIMTVMHKPEPLTANPTDWVVEDIPAGTFRVNRATLVDESVFRDDRPGGRSRADRPVPRIPRPFFAGMHQASKNGLCLAPEIWR